MKDVIKLTFLGDVMCKREMLAAFQIEGGYCFDTLFEEMLPLFNASDYVLANLETPISFNNDKLTVEIGKRFAGKDIYLNGMQEEFLINSNN